MRKGTPGAYVKGLRLMEHYKEDDVDLGSIYDWGTDTIAVFDGLRGAGQAAMRLRLVNVRREGKPPRIQDWGVAADMQRSMLESCHSDSVQCHVIWTSHYKLIEPNSINQDDEDDFLGLGGGENPKIKDAKNSTLAANALGIYPNALGNKLPPEVGSYFNAALRVKKQVGGKKVIETVPSDGIELDNPLPTKLDKQLPIETGLAKFFELVQKG